MCWWLLCVRKCNSEAEVCGSVVVTCVGRWGLPMSGQDRLRRVTRPAQRPTAKSQIASSLSLGQRTLSACQLQASPAHLKTCSAAATACREPQFMAASHQSGPRSRRCNTGGGRTDRPNCVQLRTTRCLNEQHVTSSTAKATSHVQAASHLHCHAKAHC